MNVDFLESILYYDCELLFEAVDAVGQRYIAVHAGEFPPGCRYGCEYAGAPAFQSDLAVFKAGTIGLRSLLLSHPTKQWYTARRRRRPDRIDRAANSDHGGLREPAGRGLFRQPHRLPHRHAAGNGTNPSLAEVPL